MAILTCNCKHKFQDKKYGRNRRVFNPKDPRKPGQYSCTVCGRDYSGPVGNTDKKGKK